MNRSKPQEQLNLAETAHRAVLDDILTGRLRGGTVIQERKLATRLGISRSPMRDALKRLEGEGLLVRLTERLLTVRVITLEDYLHTLDVRSAVEPLAAALATAHVSDAEHESLEQLLVRMETGEPGAERYHWDFDDQLHDTLARRSGNAFLARIIQEMRRYTRIFEQNAAPALVMPGLDDHREILAALKARNPERMRKAMAAHIRNVRRRTLDNL